MFAALMFDEEVSDSGNHFRVCWVPPLNRLPQIKGNALPPTEEYGTEFCHVDTHTLTNSTIGWNSSGVIR